MIVKTKYPDYLMHYGRSIDDGAPGVGTGNWRRGGSVRAVVTKDPEGGFRYKYISKDGVAHDTAIGAHAQNAYNSAKKMFGAVKSKVVRKKKDSHESDRRNEKLNAIVSIAAKNKKLVDAYERYKKYDMELNPYIAEYVESDRAVDDAKKFIISLKQPDETDPDWHENNSTLVNDVIANEWKELFWDYEVPRNKKAKEASDKMGKAHQEVIDITTKIRDDVFENMDPEVFGHYHDLYQRNLPYTIEAQLDRNYIRKYGEPEDWTSYLKNKK